PTRSTVFPYTTLFRSEFGTVVEGNVGDFLKFLPGITIDTGGGDARTISMNGVPSNNVPVTVGGFALASAQSSGTARTIELEQVRSEEHTSELQSRGQL